MITFKGIIFANRTAFEGVNTSVFNYYKAKHPDHGFTNTWSKGIDSLDDSKVLMPLDERVLDYPSFNPHTIVDIETTDPKWFNQNPEI